MLNFINSIRLVDITPLVNNLSFDRSRVHDEDADIKFSLKTELSDNEQNEHCRLIITADAVGSQTEGPEIFTLTLSVEYIFKVVDPNAFFPADDEERIKLASNFSYLDYRQRLTLILDGTGMTGFKLPFSIEGLKTP